MKKKRKTKGPNLAKIGEAIVNVATSAKDVVKVAVIGLKKKAMAAAKGSTKQAKRGAKVTVKPKSAGKKAASAKKAATTKKASPTKKAAPTKKASATKSKKKR